MNDWIRADERLPEKDGTYLVCTDKSKAFVAHFYVLHGRFSGKAARNITYWQPLPEPPEGR